jgi:hypothetical protein
LGWRIAPDRRSEVVPVNFSSFSLSRGVVVYLLLCAGFAAAANNPVPTVVAPTVPQAVVPDSGAFTLKVYGANFVQGSVVNSNRQARATTFVSARELQAQILASDIATPTAGYITVTNPPPGGGVSSSSYAIVEVHKPTGTIVPKRTQILFAGTGSALIELADFINDGILDLAAAFGDAEIRILLGNGDGTFSFGSVATENYYGSGPAAIAVGDFNNAGNEDLVFGSGWSGPPTQLEVNLGDGDGKFHFGSRSGDFSPFPFQIVAGDFNRDGDLDAAVSETGTYLFLGSGNGNLKQRVHYPNVGSGGILATADFNGDGILDLLVGYYGFSLMLGNGDGTFQKSQVVIPFHGVIGCNFGPSFFVTDFNNDGIPDVAFCSSDYADNTGTIWIALGNGDGTFRKKTSIVLHPDQGAFSFAVGDFNSDGKTDLVADYLVSDTESQFALFLGNGDGTFRPKKLVQIGGGVHEDDSGIVSGDFNSDGLLDFIIQDPGQAVVVVQK